MLGHGKLQIWAVKFYEKNGFQLVPEAEKNRLLRTYWRYFGAAG